jgi:xanthine dehydrogenase large subunit
MKIAGKALPHESACGHVTGEALYTDDLVARFPGVLHAWPVLAPYSHALLTRLETEGAMEEPGVVATLTDADVPGEGTRAPTGTTSPCFPSKSFTIRSLWRGCLRRLSRQPGGGRRECAQIIARYRRS